MIAILKNMKGHIESVTHSSIDAVLEAGCNHGEQVVN